MTYLPENLPAFLWTKTGIEDQSLVLTISDELLSQTRMFTQHDYKILRKPGYFDSKEILLERVARIVATAYSYLALKYILKKENTFSAFICYPLLFSTMKMIAKSQNKDIKNRFKSACIQVTLVVLTTLSLINDSSACLLNAKCLAVNFTLGALFKAFVWKNDSTIQQAFNKYFTLLHNSDSGRKESDSLTVTSYNDSDLMNSDMRTTIGSFFSSDQLLTLRRVSKAFLYEIPSQYFLFVRIKEKFSEQFITAFGQKKLLKLLEKDPIKLTTDRSIHFLCCSMEHKTLGWAKKMDGLLILFFKTLEPELNALFTCYSVEGFNTKLTYNRYYKTENGNGQALIVKVDNDDTSFKDYGNRTFTADLFKRLTSPEFEEVF